MTTGETADQRALRRQTERYTVRFNDAFWAFWDAEAAPRLPDNPRIVDLGCGPGMFLRDVSNRLPGAMIEGYDINRSMLDNAASLGYEGPVPHLGTADLTKMPLPLVDASVDLLCATAVVHTLEDPFSFFAEAKRVLKPGGFFLLYDWVRVPMEAYFAGRQEEPGDPPDARWPRALEQFAIHNKYTAEDWHWIFGRTGMAVEVEATPHPRSRCWLLR